MATWTLPCHRHVLVDLLSLISSSIETTILVSGKKQASFEQAANCEQAGKNKEESKQNDLHNIIRGQYRVPVSFYLYSSLCVKKRVSIFTVGFVVLTFTR